MICIYRGVVRSDPPVLTAHLSLPLLGSKISSRELRKLHLAFGEASPVVVGKLVRVCRDVRCFCLTLFVLLPLVLVLHVMLVTHSSDGFLTGLGLSWSQGISQGYSPFARPYPQKHWEVCRPWSLEEDRAYFSSRLLRDG